MAIAALMMKKNREARVLAASIERELMLASEL